MCKTNSSLPFFPDGLRQRGRLPPRRVRPPLGRGGPHVREGAGQGARLVAPARVVAPRGHGTPPAQPHEREGLRQVHA